MAGRVSNWTGDLKVLRHEPVLWALVIMTLVSAVISFVSLRALGALVPVSLAIALVVYCVQTRSFPTPPRTLLFVFCVFVLLVGLAAFRSLDADYALGRFFKLATAALIAVLLWALARQLSVLSALKGALLLSCLVGLCWGLVEGVSDGAVYAMLRDVSLSEAAYSSNRAMVVLALLVWPAALITSQRYGAAAGPGLVAFLFVVALTGESQAVQLSVFASMGVLGSALIVPRATLWGLGILGCFVILSLPFLISQLGPISLGEGVANAELTILPRMEIWHFVSEKILAQPLLGYGLEAGRFMPLDDMTQVYFTDVHLHHPHNGVLQIWFEMGVLGALALATAWGLLMRQVSLLSEKDAPFVLAGLCCAFIIGSVAHGVWQSWWVGALALLPFFYAVACAERSE